MAPIAVKVSPEAGRPRLSRDFSSVHKLRVLPIGSNNRVSDAFQEKGSVRIPIKRFKLRFCDDVEMLPPDPSPSGPADADAPWAFQSGRPKREAPENGRTPGLDGIAKMLGISGKTVRHLDALHRAALAS